MVKKTTIRHLKKYIPRPTHLLVYKQSVIKLSKNSILHDHTKHIVIKHHFIRKKVQEGEMQVY
jgi:hypothetical protein